MDLLILTGHTSGLGRQILLEGQARHMAVLAMARRSLGVESDTFRECKIDLSIDSPWEELLDKNLGQMKGPWKRVFLINCAGGMEPVGPIAELPLDGLTASMHLNALAPLRLMRWALQHFASLPLRITNISSGAARKAYEGWALYCSSKAALRMMSEVLACEMKSAGREVRVLCYAPGVIDTPMQAKLQSLDIATFPELDRFKRMREEGQLVDPKSSAIELFERLLSDDLPYFSEYRYGDLLGRQISATQTRTTPS